MPNIYVGANNSSVTIDSTNIGEYFTISNGTYKFVGSGTSFSSNNKNVPSSIAYTALIAKVAFSAISFSYSVSSESNYDKLTITVGSTTVANAISGSKSSSWSGSLAAGGQIVLRYSKNGRVNKNNDCGTISNIKLTLSDGTDVARPAKKIYIGVNGVAKTVKKIYIGVNNQAKLCYPDPCDMCESECSSSCEKTCEDYCESYCEDYCESHCEDYCESVGQCSCESYCELNCQCTDEGCESCECTDEGCQDYCESYCETCSELCECADNCISCDSGECGGECMGMGECLGPCGEN